MTETERVWARIKASAKKLAAMERTLSPHHAKEMVSKIIRAEHAECPPQEALTYLADELRAFIAQYAQENAVRESSSVR